MHRTILYRKFKSLLPPGLRRMLSAVNQRLFARWTLRRRYGAWFDVDWKKKFRSLSRDEWVRAYDDAWKHHADDCVQESELELIRSALPESGSVLDAGCGQGRVALHMARNGFRVCGLDVSPEALRRAAENAEREGLTVEWKQGFLEELPFRDGEFDCVVCCHTLEHVQDLERAAAELKRVARNRIIILVPRQEYRLYASDYHTFFFDTSGQLTGAFNLRRHTCRLITSSENPEQFVGEAWFYVGEKE